MTTANSLRPDLPRVPLIDCLRGFALLAMAVYHFTWDLEFFGWLPPETIVQTGWVIFARSIASSFLVLVGISLFLAHSEGIRWPTFWKRLAQVVVAAALISVATWFAFSDSFIFFGVLHGIALFSLLGLLFVRLHWIVSLAVAAILLIVWKSFSHELFSHTALWWVGLAPLPPRSNDYVPLFPWFAAVLMGIAIAKIIKPERWQKLAKVGIPALIQKPLGFLGRHSLVFYLVHQPVLLAFLWTFTTFIAEPDRTANFILQCKTECSKTNGEMFCQPYCACMTETLVSERLFTPFIDRDMDDAKFKRLYEIRDICVEKQK